MSVGFLPLTEIPGQMFITGVVPVPITFEVVDAMGMVLVVVVIGIVDVVLVVTTAGGCCTAAGWMGPNLSCFKSWSNFLSLRVIPAMDVLRAAASFFSLFFHALFSFRVNFGPPVIVVVPMVDTGIGVA